MTKLKTVEDLVNQGIISFDNAIEARKDAQTYIRKPRPEEIGTVFVTYVERDGIIKEESRNVIREDSYIWRNTTPFSDGVRYNERVNTQETLRKNYGDVEPDYEFKLYKKINTIKIIQITDEIAQAIGSTEEGEVSIEASRGGAVTGAVGDYLVESGYILNQREFQNTCIIVNQKDDLADTLKEDE